MKKALAGIVAGVLLTGGIAFCEVKKEEPEHYFQKYENFILKEGEYIKEKDGVLQKYENHIIQNGKYYTFEGEGNYYQLYINYIIQTGDFIGDDGQVFEEFLPQIGESFEMMDVKE